MANTTNLKTCLVMSVFLLAAACATAMGGTIYVDDDAPNDQEPNNPDISDPNEDGSPEHPFDAIQEGINAAIDGDIVIVLTGTFTGTGNRDIDYGGKAITVRSTDPNDPNVVAATIIDCNGTEAEPHRGFYFHNSEDGNSILNGFTITGGYAEEGGGIYCDGVATKITNCLIYGNSADYGGGIYRKNTVSEVSNCIIRNNDALEGGGVYSDGDPYFIQGYKTITYELFGRIYTKFIPVYGSGKFVNCEIKDNSADKGSGIYYEDSVSEISDCIIVNNTADYGGGIKCNNASLELINNTIAENTAIYSGGGIYCVGPNSTAVITNCILWDNTAADGNEITLCDSSAIDVNYSNVKGGQAGIYNDGSGTVNWGSGNIDADLCFIRVIRSIEHESFERGMWRRWTTEETVTDYHLLPDSPCIDAGDPNYVPGPNETDLDGDPRIINGRVDMGADESTYPPKPDLIFVKDLYEFNVAAGQLHQFTVDINNVDNVTHNLSGLSIVQQAEGLSVRFMEPGVTQPVSVSAGGMFIASLEVDANDAAAGSSTYSLWAKCLTDGDPQRADYTELRFAVVLDANQPDLELTSEDITFEPLPGEPGQSVTISAAIRNIGAATAEDVVVVFKDFDSTIGTSMVIPSILPGDSNTVSIQHTWPDASFRLITVTADPDDEISELDETNNSGSKVYQVGAVPEMEASIVVSCSAPAGFPEGTIATISGEAFYEIRVAHQGDYVYLPANSSSVSVRIIYSSGENELPRLFTDMQGYFNVTFPVPGQADDEFDVVITITDGFLESVWQKRFDVYEPNPRKDIWVYSEDITFDNNNPSVGETISIEAVINASAYNTKKELNVPVTFYAHHPTLGTFSIDSTQIAQMPPGTNESVDANWTNEAEGIYCIEVALEPGFSDDNNGNNRASRPLVVGPAPANINVVIETPLENADVNASDTTPVTVLVTDNHGNIMIPCVFDSLNLQFSGVDGRRVDLKRYFNWSSSRYVYPWRPPTDANGQACLEVTAQTVNILGSVLTDSNSICVNVVDNAPPTFWIGCSPRSAMAGQVVHITVNTSEPLLNDEPNSITVTDSNGQPIPLDPCGPDHPWSTRWVYQTELLPMETAKGTATITVTGRDMRLNAGSGEGHFAVVTGDLWVYSQDITFSDSNPDLGETITIGAVIHSSSDNTATVGHVPVTFYANHTVVGIYTKIGRTLYIDEISPGDNYLVSTTWRNAAEGAYIIKATIGPEFSDDNNGNNEATRALFVGTECDFTDDGEVDSEDLAIFAAQWLWVGQAGSIPEDIINDGTINFADFAKLAGNWAK